MFYFVKSGDRIEKYQVCFDKDSLEKLKIEIINNCSEIEHYEYDSTDGPNKHDDLRIRNYTKTEIGIREHSDFYDIAPRTLYHFSYDEYHFPYLVKLIDMLYEGNDNSVNSILNPDYFKEKTPIEIRIEELENEINLIPNVKVVEKISMLNQLSNLMAQSRLNETQISVKEYYPKVQELIKLKLVDSISIVELEKVESFFLFKLEKPPIFK